MNLITYTETLPNGFSFEMRHIPGGTFDLGSNQDDPDAFMDEKPKQLNVEVDEFYLGKFPVTQILWKSIMGVNSNPSRFIGENRPVVNVSWDDCQEFIHQLNQITEQTRAKDDMAPYRLPMEAGWEFAARGESSNAPYRYSGSDKLKEIGWFEHNCDGQTQEVGLLLPNGLGLYDLSGNVWEWIADNWHKDYNGFPNNGQPWLNQLDEDYGLTRGGSYLSEDLVCRTQMRSGSSRKNRLSFVGFRLAMSRNNKTLQ